VTVGTESPLADVLLTGTPFIDVRAEVEFSRGTIPGAVNLPILDTVERERVGTCYKKQGQDAAIALGHRLVNGATKDARVAAWCGFARSYPQAWLYCWRGGLRSRTAAQWMAEAGMPVRVVPGGFKALRQRLIDELEQPVRTEDWFIIGGRTGSAKTALINELPGGVDLEGFARHRGSSFGSRAGNPPTQVDFENALALELMKQRSRSPGRCLFLDDESRQIGALSVPLEVYRRMRETPVAVLEVSLEQRVSRILHDYIRVDLDEHLALDAENGFTHFAQQLEQSLWRIRKRLGAERFLVASRLLQSALSEHRSRGETEGHRAWISLLLEEYYDPMYDYQLGNAAGRVVFRGDTAAVREWALNRC
jgi:tRNA 2-selenouridine synthase